MAAPGPVALLDANVLIALTDQDHAHHAIASRWLGKAATVAVCPITEGALIRYHVRRGNSAARAKGILAQVLALPRCEFWADSVSYTAAELGHVLGHREVTDAYLVALVRARPGSRLATFDGALAQRFPILVERVPL
jgi:toxin-antitoxin system PIN domain toxin